MQTVLLMAKDKNGGGSANGRDLELIEGMIATLPMAKGLSPRQVKALASQSRTQQLRRGALIVQRGDRLPGIIAVAYGSAKVTLRRPDGDEKVIRFLGSGDSYGEASALNDRPCPVDVVALEDSLMVVIAVPPVLQLLETDSRFARNVVRLLSDKFLGLLSELESSLQQSALQRLAAYLASLAVRNGATGIWIARLPASKTAVAARIGITKETMSRLLHELADRRLIAVAQRDIEISDLPALAQVAR